MMDEEELLVRIWREVWQDFYLWKLEHVELPSLASLDPPNPSVAASPSVAYRLPSIRTTSIPGTSELEFYMWTPEDLNDSFTLEALSVTQYNIKPGDPYPPYESCI